MKTLKQVEVIPVFVEDTIPELSDMKEFHVYISLKYNGSCHKCLCGCGEQVYLPLGEERNGWVLQYTENKKIVTFTPSIGNYQFDCKSHYIITKNKANFV